MTVRLAQPLQSLLAREERPRRAPLGDSALARADSAPRQIGIFLAAYALYDAARWTTAGDIGPALRHAHWVLGVERGLGMAVERPVQRALDKGVVEWVLSNVYLAAQLVVVPAALIWLYRRDRAVFRRVRDAIVATWLLSVPIYAAFPVAPPRLAGLGMVDTVSDQAAVALTGHSTIFYNPYAAVPSLHCGFAFAIGIALAAAARRPATRALALLWGPLVSLTVVATANHYVLDIAAGMLATGAGYLVARLPERIAAAVERPDQLAAAPTRSQSILGPSRCIIGAAMSTDDTPPSRLTVRRPGCRH